MASRKKTEDDSDGAELGRFDKLLTSDLFAKIKKQHGSSILTVASEQAVVSIPRIPSGVFGLDLALGGGWAVGRVNTLYGHKSTGKTSLITRAIGNAQKMCANCWGLMDLTTGEVCQCKKFRETVVAYLDVEGTFDIGWAAKLGVDPRRLLLSIPDYAEQTLDIAEALIRSGEVDVLVIDSLAFLTPQKEIEESAGKELQAQQSRTLGRGIRKFVSAMNYVGNKTDRRPTLFYTNQIRTKLGVMFGNPETTPGGYAPGFSSSIEVKTSGGKYTLDEVTKKPLCVDLDFKVEKNKVSVAKMAGTYRLLLADTATKKVGDVVDEPAMVELGIQVGLVEKDGNGWSYLGVKYRSKDTLLTHIEDDMGARIEFAKALSAIYST